MADELLLASTRVQPTRLAGMNFEYEYPELKGALKHLVEAKAQGGALYSTP